MIAQMMKLNNFLWKKQKINNLVLIFNWKTKGKNYSKDPPEKIVIFKKLKINIDKI